MARGDARNYRGWLVQRDGGHDTPWMAWKPGKFRLRADTLEGVKALIRDYKEE